jgi:regulator of replication initiation timing
MYNIYKYWFYVSVIVLIGIISIKSCTNVLDNNSNTTIDSLKKETKYLLQDLAITRTSYSETIKANDSLKLQTKALKDSLKKLKVIKKPSKPKVTKGSDIDSTHKDSSFVLASDYDKLEVKFDSLNVEYDSCLFYANQLLAIVDKKDKIIAVKDSLNARQNKGFDKIIEINDELLKEEYKRGIRKGRKQGAIFAWVTETLALIGITNVK